jgi:AcrR family transcriptional regulator
VTTKKREKPKRAYELGKRLDQMDRSRRAILSAARRQLEARGYRQMTMGSLAAESGVTRQTIHNLFGTKVAVLEALFDTIALDGGMERMRDVMTQPSAEQMLEGFVGVFCGFWASHRMLIRRIHGIGAIDPELGAVIEARNRRRLSAATRIAQRIGGGLDAEDRAASLAALTSFECFDALAESTRDETRAGAFVAEMVKTICAGWAKG